MHTKYSLQLANGQIWQFVAGKGTESWVEELASIMELKSCELSEYPKLIFIRGNTIRNKKPKNPIYILHSDMRSNLPKVGWKPYNLDFLRFWFHPNVPDVICDIGIEKNHNLDIWRMWSVLYPVYRYAQGSGGIPIHAGLVERDGTGVLLSAPGGTGKSTCCRRIPSPWRALCDDETLVVLDKQGQYMVHPFPTWADRFLPYSKKWNVQQYLPLRAIFFLERSENDEVVHVGQGKSAVLINESATWIWDRGWRYVDHEEKIALKKRLFDNACELARSIPAFMLRVSPAGRFWEEIEKALEYAS